MPDRGFVYLTKIYPAPFDAKRLVRVFSVGASFFLSPFPRIVSRLRSWRDMFRRPNALSGIRYSDYVGNWKLPLGWGWGHWTQTISAEVLPWGDLSTLSPAVVPHQTPAHAPHRTEGSVFPRTRFCISGSLCCLDGLEVRRVKLLGDTSVFLLASQVPLQRFPALAIGVLLSDTTFSLSPLPSLSSKASPLG